MRYPGGRYPGGKNAAGTYQRIINLIPPHRYFVETFAGSASVFFHKRLAEHSILLERDRDQCRALRELIGADFWFDRDLPVSEKARARTAPIHSPRVIVADALRWLPVAQIVQSPETFVYCDPPYLPSTLADPERKIYKHQLTEAQHVELLGVLCELPCAVMLSGYPSTLYDKYLKPSAAGWREVQFRVMTRGGNSRLESLWMNYPQPYELHDYSYLGEDYRKRQDFKRLRERWLTKISGMDDLRRYALLSALALAEAKAKPTPKPLTANEAMLDAMAYNKQALKKGKQNGSKRKKKQRESRHAGKANGGGKRTAAAKRGPGRPGRRTGQPDTTKK